MIPFHPNLLTCSIGSLAFQLPFLASDHTAKSVRIIWFWAGFSTTRYTHILTKLDKRYTHCARHNSATRKYSTWTPASLFRLFILWDKTRLIGRSSTCLNWLSPTSNRLVHSIPRGKETKKMLIAAAQIMPTRHAFYPRYYQSRAHLSMSSLSLVLLQACQRTEQTRDAFPRRRFREQRSGKFSSAFQTFGFF